MKNNTFAVPHAVLLILGFCLSLTGENRVAAGVVGPWTQFQGNAAHTGYMTGSIDPARITPIWTVTSASLGEASLVQGVVTDAHNVYLTTYNHSAKSFAFYDVLALDRYTGATAWSRQVASYGGQVSAPAVGNDTVYVHQWGHSGISGGNAAQYPYVTGINALSGAISFATSHSGQWSSGSRPTVADNQVFAAGGYYGGMDAYNGTSGSKQWFQGLSQDYGWIPAADGQNVYAYFGGLVALDRQTGIQAFTIPNPPDSSHYDAIVFVGQQNDALVHSTGGLTSFSLNTHSVQWKVSGNFTGAMAIDAGIVFAANGIELDLLDERTGTKLNSWFAPPAVALSGNLLLSDNLIFVGTTAGTYALDRSTLTVVWSTSLVGDLALGSNRLLISTPTALYAYAVPEPSSLALLGSGLLGLASFVLRRRRT